MKILNEIANEVFQQYQHFYKTDDDIENQISHLLGEVEELKEAIESGKESSWADCDIAENDIEHFEKYIKDTIQDELADILIMTLSFCRLYGMTLSKYDIAWHIKNKMRYNKYRIKAQEEK